MRQISSSSFDEPRAAHLRRSIATASPDGERRHVDAFGAALGEAHRS